MNILQATVDGISAQMQRERTQTQMTLGELIARLEAIPEETPVALGMPHSYRGYYCDLAFEPIDGRPAREVLLEARLVMGKTLVGYKGGDFLMGEPTPLWVAAYGGLGDRLISVADDGTLETEGEVEE